MTTPSTAPAEMKPAKSNRTMIYAAIVIIIIIIAGAAAYFIFYSNPCPTTTAATVTIVEAAGTVNGNPNYYFNPKGITVKTCTTVTWHNSGAALHTVTTNSGQAISFDMQVAVGQNVTYTFSKTGNFTYYCTLHPWMKAYVLVSS